MKALLCTHYGTPDDLTLADIPDPVAGPGEVTMRVEAAALNFFDTLIIAVYAYPAAKKPLFSVEERMQLWQEVIEAEELTNVRVDTFPELLVEYVRSVGGQAIVKGLRSPNDFEAEFQQGLMNRKLAPEIETICLLTNLEQLFVSSSLLKEVARLGGDVTDMLPSSVVLALQKKFGL